MPLQVICLWGGGKAEEVTFPSRVRSFQEGANRARPVPLVRAGWVPCRSVGGAVAFFPTSSVGAPAGWGSEGH